MTRRAEHHHVAATRLAVTREAEVRERNARPVGQLVDEEVVADQKGRKHRARGDPERVDHKDAQQQGQPDGQHHRARLVEDATPHG
jgi:hypothetical protein